ncbi:pirin family protein [Moraxella nasibovis]|uniref:pirin family protein n=1 Tax=Moraxella nasibovis TaxID=2904120 RepID=UPI002410A707|nr:pirin family protein [Moraxella nasibovis]WFF39124.1 pirin family protein [Moraxella nasibovis]
MSNQKQVAHIHPAPPKHWVGDGFYVSSMFNYSQTGRNLDPFLLMDYASPQEFAPNFDRNLRGVGEHPHRGFETVTIAYQGEIEHKDSYGGGGVIGTGGVQWMTAGSGLMHQEYHSENFSKTGGMFEMVQLWVNLPAKDKMTAPKYQAIDSNDIPVVDLNGNGIARIIAGDFDGTHGTASTFSPINLWDIRLNPGGEYSFTIPETHNLLILILDGVAVVNDNKTARPNELISFEKGGDTVKLTANDDAKILILSGEPLNEPVVGYGPFVMNTMDEINQAISDVRAGKFGQIVQ